VNMFDPSDMVPSSRISSDVIGSSALQQLALRLARKRPVFPSGIGWVGSLAISSWFKRKEQNVVLADFGRLPRSGRL
jgi:hypothetical protein